MPEQSPLEYDAVIIGTGQAGPPLAGKLTAAGMSVAIIERKRFGGTCVNTGCTPTKALIASAREAHMARRASDFGVRIGSDVKVDMQAVKARKDAIVRPKTEGVESWLREMENCTVHTGHAVFEAPNLVRVDEIAMRAERIFINVGARANIPDISGLESVPYLTDSSMMEIDFLPEHLLIVGGGYVALEFAQMYRRFGSDVTILERGDRIAKKEDPDISRTLQEILERDGVRVRLNSSPGAVRSGENDRVELSVESEGRAETVSGSHLLIATGRRPNTDDLGLDAAGIRHDERGYIEVDETLRTSQPHVWALGDCNGQGAFTHTSYNDHEIVAANLLESVGRWVSDRIPVYAIYTDPPLGRVGITEAEARKKGLNALVGRLPMEQVARAQERSETNGLMKIIVDGESGEFLGAALLGIGCDEVVHLLVDMMAAKAPYQTVRDAVHIHPTVAELIPTLLERLEPI